MKTNDNDEVESWPLDVWFSLIEKAEAGDITAHDLLCKIYIEKQDRRQTQRVLLEAYIIRYFWLSIRNR